MDSRAATVMGSRTYNKLLNKTFSAAIPLYKSKIVSLERGFQVEKGDDG